jgi:hypothetical protein
MKSAAALATAVMLLVPALNAQNQSTRPTSQIELTGCVSDRANETGTFTFTDTQTGGKYRLTGRKMQNYAGKMVAVFGGGPNKRLAVRGGLWPSPNAAGQAGAVDPAQESISRQTGGAAARGDAVLPEFNVVRVRAVDGSCQK